jgi:nucleoid-associated protein YgaU
MALLDNLLKLQKLKILAFSDGERSQAKKVGTFEAMFNPDSFKQNYAIKYGKNRSPNSSERKGKYVWSEPSELSLDLVLDGSGVSEMGVSLLFGGPKTVSEQIKEFLNLTVHMNGEIHEPNYLRVEWGSLEFNCLPGSKFDCRLGSVEINYTNFNPDGTPLRAKLTVSLISDMEVKKRMAIEDKKSSDLTHRRIVREGDTLPLMTREVYGSSADYLRVARANGLDNFRQLIPGQELIFPPLPDLLENPD